MANGEVRRVVYGRPGTTELTLIEVLSRVIVLENIDPWSVPEIPNTALCYQGGREASRRWSWSPNAPKCPMLGEYLYSKCEHRHLESFEALLMLIHGRPNFLVPVIQDKRKIGRFPSLVNLFSQAPNPECRGEGDVVRYRWEYFQHHYNILTRDSGRHQVCMVFVNYLWDGLDVGWWYF